MESRIIAQNPGGPESKENELAAVSPMSRRVTPLHINYILRLFKNLECRVFKTGYVKKSSSGQALSTKDSTDWEFAGKLHMKTLSLLGLGNYRN